MPRKRYPLTAFLFALMLALTGYQMAVARAQPSPAGQLVICSGLGLVTVLVDENGQPVSQVHVCPDGLLTLFSGLDSGWEPAERAERWVRVVPVAVALRTEGQRSPAPQARGPPSSI
jgi:hypothetical protein